jgi:hypothetical protein
MKESVHKGAIALVLSITLASGAVVQDVRALKIVPLQGEGALNNVKTGRGADCTVEVRDQDDRPVEGAQVTFTLPFTGPGASFANGERVLRGTTDNTGRAHTTGLKPNKLEGRFNIKVVASYEGKQATAVISQSNTAAGGQLFEQQGGGKAKWYVLLGAIGAGATAGIVAATRGDDPSVPAPIPTTLSVGNVTVGGPR